MAWTRYPRIFKSPECFGGLHETLRALESATTLTFCGGSELAGNPFKVGVTFGLVVDVALADGAVDEDALGAGVVGVGLAEGAAGVPAIILIRGKDGKPDPSDVYVLT